MGPQAPQGHHGRIGPQLLKGTMAERARRPLRGAAEHHMHRADERAVATVGEWSKDEA